MEAVQSGDGPARDSPMSADVVDKLTGDDDLDFTITMNESEDEGSSDVSTNDPVKHKSSAPVTVNGKTLSDGESQGSILEEKNDTEADTPSRNKDVMCKQKQEEVLTNGEGEREREENGHVEATSQHADKETVGSTNEDEKERLDNVQEKNVQEKQRCQTEDNVEDENSESKKPAEEQNAKVNCHQDSSNDSASVPKSDKDKSSKAEQKETESNEKYVSDDDDIVEIGGSPMKFTSGKRNSSAVTVNSARGGGTSSASLAISSAANLVPYLGSLPGASFVPSSSGMQLVLPSGTSGVQGLGTMFIPGNTNFFGTATSSATVFQSSLGNSAPAQAMAQNSASLMYPQYSNMSGSQSSRNAMLSYSQGTRPPAMHPALANIPEKPTSSVGMIEMIRWEVENHINIKPKYVKPQPKAELGHLAKWVFDLGSDMAKEYVYHDLVRIQRRRNDEGNLSAKEKDDFAKLQEIDRELNHKVGHLKFRLNKSCRCGFRTELNNVLFHHQQCAHNDRGGFLRCILCKFSSRQANAFRFHMESEHGRAGCVENHPSFYECPLCPYETNYTNRLEQHKTRCQRQYREAVNLHPSCLTGPEVNLCLENVFYFVFTRQFMNSIIPKTQANAKATATKIRDMPARTSDPILQTRKGAGNISTATTTTVPSSNRQILPRNALQYQQQGTPYAKQQSQVRAALSRNLPANATKMNTVQNQGFTPNATSVRAQQPRPPEPPNQPNNGFEVCEICGGYVKDRKALRIHFYYAHRIDMPFGVFERPQPPLYCATCFARFWTAQGLQKHIEVHKNDMMNAAQNSSGVAGKCISCGHRVPNILMHMRMVHNREMRHYLAALMCIFCGARFTTKNEVEDHMGKVHGIAIRSSKAQGSMNQPQLAHPPGNAVKAPVKAATPAGRPASGVAAPKPGSSGKTGRNSQCVLCNLSFSRNVDLTRHCMRVHHTCMKCGLVVVDKESLARHTCLHSASGMRTCQICNESGFHPAYYIKHMRDKHLRKCSVVLRHIDRAVVETIKRPITISDSDEDESADQSTSPKQRKTEAKQVVGAQDREEKCKDLDKEEKSKVSVKESDTLSDEKQQDSSNNTGLHEKEQESSGDENIAADEKNDAGLEAQKMENKDMTEDEVDERTAGKPEIEENHIQNSETGADDTVQKKGCEELEGESVDGCGDGSDPNITNSELKDMFDQQPSPKPVMGSDCENKEMPDSATNDNCEQSDIGVNVKKRKLESGDSGEENPDCKVQRLSNSKGDESLD